MNETNDVERDMETSKSTETKKIDRCDLPARPLIVLADADPFAVYFRRIGDEGAREAAGSVARQVFGVERED